MANPPSPIPIAIVVKVPDGGAANETLRKASALHYDMEWTAETYVECRTDDPVAPADGREWLRVDLYP